MQRSRRKSKRQQAWEYMRRNRNFRVGDVMMITGISAPMIVQLLRQLKQIGYAQQVQSAQKLIDKQFVLMQNTGVICPIYVQNAKKIYDRNIEKFLTRVAQ